jgi:hypothetical protein
VQALLYYWLVVQPVLKRLEQVVPRHHVLPMACSETPRMEVATTGESKIQTARDPSKCSSKRHTIPKTKY